MKKNFVIIITLILLLITFSGCSGNTNRTSSDTSSSNNVKSETYSNTVISEENITDNSQPLNSISSDDVNMDTILTKLDKSLLSDYDYSKLKNQNITLNVCNWGEYMAVNQDDYFDVNQEFEKLTGIKVNYKTFATNEELYSKLKSGGGDYDIVIPSDYMISKMIKEGLIQKLDFSNIPNFSYIDKKFVGLEYDPENEYSVPYTWGIVCIVYNKNMVKKEITGWCDLWDEANDNNILMFNNPRDAFGIALTYLGYSQNTEDKKELEEAASTLKQQKNLVQAYVMDEIFDKIGGESSAIAPYYAGDVQTMIDENPNLDFCIPKEGTNKFVDAACIPTAAKNKEAAEMYINFLNEIQVAYANCDYLCYSTPHTGVYSLFDDEIKTNPLRCPPDDYLNEKTEVFINLSDETNAYTQELWNQIKIEKSKSPWLVPAFLLISIALTFFLNIRRSRKKKQDIF